MARKLLILQPHHIGDLYIPGDEHLGTQLAQILIHNEFFKLRFPEFQCPLLKSDLRSEVRELFELHTGFQRFPLEHVERLIDMGVGYSIALQEMVSGMQAQHNRDPLLVLTEYVHSDRVVLAV